MNFLSSNYKHYFTPHILIRKNSTCIIMMKTRHCVWASTPSVPFLSLSISLSVSHSVCFFVPLSFSPHFLSVPRSLSVCPLAIISLVSLTVSLSYTRSLYPFSPSVFLAVWLFCPPLFYPLSLSLSFSCSFSLAVSIYPPISLSHTFCVSFFVPLSISLYVSLIFLSIVSLCLTLHLFVSHNVSSCCCQVLRVQHNYL